MTGRRALSRISCGGLFVVLGLGLLAVGLRRETVECERASDLCRISTDTRMSVTTAELRIRDITEHSYEPQSKRRGQISLVDREGERRTISHGPDDVASANYAALHTFLVGDAPTVRLVTGPWSPAIYGGTFILVLAPLGFYHGWRGRRAR